MDDNILKVNEKNIKFWLILLGCLSIILLTGWLLLKRLEGEKPAVALDLSSPYLNASQTLSVAVSDEKSGLRKIWIGLVKDGKEVVLLKEDLPAAGLLGGGKLHQAIFKIKVEPRHIGITDGKAILRMVARDYSWRGWFHGNRTYVEKDVTIDTKPPEIDILTTVHNVSQGGAGLVIFKISEPCPTKGVYVGGNFFPGYSGYFKNPNIIMVLFALNYGQGPGTELYVKTSDYAGNSARTSFPHYLRGRVFKRDLIEISDNFLNWKMPEFDIDIPSDSKTAMIDKYLKVNRDLRQADYNQITQVVDKTDNIIYWDSPFLQLPNSQKKAGFADHRKYKYKGSVVDEQIHLGIDLASVAHSPVPAANKGKVVFAGPIGIYGKTVIIDHGFGLFSMYSHLSGIDAQEGQIVAKDEIIGRTGTTGLAGGDHLHFSMLVHNTFVDPLEWWDAAWIKNNITAKIEDVKPMN
uniref:M23 family metallopeptidase n=1 Tax=Candidatus Desulfatibia profunda TaxID=2841695 RepID=A0A8J6TL91_9BACT|nr:M23 family metallopeptidase [Candidatus Desulfatibia profunda]